MFQLTFFESNYCCRINKTHTVWILSLKKIPGIFVPHTRRWAGGLSPQPRSNDTQARGFAPALWDDVHRQTPSTPTDIYRCTLSPLHHAHRPQPPSTCPPSGSRTGLLRSRERASETWSQTILRDNLAWIVTNVNKLSVPVICITHACSSARDTTQSRQAAGELCDTVCRNYSNGKRLIPLEFNSVYYNTNFSAKSFEVFASSWTVWCKETISDK
jgi:hypothetical protein